MQEFIVKIKYSGDKNISITDIEDKLNDEIVICNGEVSETYSSYEYEVEEIK